MDKLDYGIIVTRGDEQLKLFFTDDQHWDSGDVWGFTVIAMDAAGREYAISYTPPRLDQDEDELDCDYYDRCAEETDWSRPNDVERLGSLMEYDCWEPNADPECSVTWWD